MLGVAKEGTKWAFTAPCGARGAPFPESRDQTREAYKTHRASCAKCKTGAQESSAKKEIVKDIPVEHDAVEHGIAAAQKTAIKHTPKGAKRKPAEVKKTVVERVIGKDPALAAPYGTQEGSPIVTADDKALFAKLLAENDSVEAAWTAIRKAFPRERWGKVREITKRLSDHKTFAAAWAAAR